MIAETGWSTEEIDVEHHSGMRANIMYCNKCQGDSNSISKIEALNRGSINRKTIL